MLLNYMKLIEKNDSLPLRMAYRIGLLHENEQIRPKMDAQDLELLPSDNLFCRETLLLKKNPQFDETKLDYEIDKIFTEISANLDIIKKDNSNNDSFGNLLNIISRLSGGGLKIKNK
ncbi:uncharacterized protein isoform X2 [Rhodnius prolixus]|uniref:uncharacterized protein isoform X2 n=1 Tax=Rhodnius prolixus TaxID=13249 RepID=UPI003D189343